MRLVDESGAVQPLGRLVTLNLTRSKNVDAAGHGDRHVHRAAGLTGHVGRPDPEVERAQRPEPRDIEQLLVDAVRVRRVLPVEVAEVLERFLHLGRRRIRAARLVERDRAGDRRRGHGRPRRDAVGVAGPRREDALAGRDEVDVAAVVAEVRERVVLVVAAPRVARAATEAAAACRPYPRGPRR